MPCHLTSENRSKAEVFAVRGLQNLNKKIAIRESEWHGTWSEAEYAVPFD